MQAFCLVKKIAVYRSKERWYSMYKKGLRSMPRTIRKEVAREYSSSDVLISLHEVNQTLEEKVHKALMQIKGVPSYWLVVSHAKANIPFIFCECKLKDDISRQVHRALVGILSILPTSTSPYYGIY